MRWKMAWQSHRTALNVDSAHGHGDHGPDHGDGDHHGGFSHGGNDRDADHHGSFSHGGNDHFCRQLFSWMKDAVVQDHKSDGLEGTSLIGGGGNGLSLMMGEASVHKRRHQ